MLYQFQLAAAREEVIQKDESHYFEIKRIQKQAKNDLCALQEKLRHSYENSKPEPIVNNGKGKPRHLVGVLFCFCIEFKTDTRRMVTKARYTFHLPTELIFSLKVRSSQFL